MGHAKGATIMAPITIAVESKSTPPVAITADRMSRALKRTRRSLPLSREEVDLTLDFCDGRDLGAIVEQQ